MLKRRRNARCTAVDDTFLMNSRTQKILGWIVAILLSTDVTARLCARRGLQWRYLKNQNLLFQTLYRSFTYHVQFRKYRRTKLSPSFLITLYVVYEGRSEGNVYSGYVLGCEISGFRRGVAERLRTFICYRRCGTEYRSLLEESRFFFPPYHRPETNLRCTTTMKGEDLLSWVSYFLP